MYAGWRMITLKFETVYAAVELPFVSSAFGMTPISCTASAPTIKLTISSGVVCAATTPQLRGDSLKIADTAPCGSAITAMRPTPSMLIGST